MGGMFERIMETPEQSRMRAFSRPVGEPAEDPAGGFLGKLFSRIMESPHDAQRRQFDTMLSNKYGDVESDWEWSNDQRNAAELLRRLMMMGGNTPGGLMGGDDNG